MRAILLISVAINICFIPFTANRGREIPTSPQAEEAIQRVEPELKQALAKAELTYGAPIYIRIFKNEKQLEIWVRGETNYRLFRTDSICTYGYGTLGPKKGQGDGQAPEGFYFVTPSRLNPWSKYHLAFDIGYPNDYDRTLGRTGGAIMVHGRCVSIGCFAMTDPVIDEIYALADAALRNGQDFFRVHIFPFRMTDDNMERQRESEWYAFWQNLKEGYDFFEDNNNIPPNIRVKDGRYISNRSD